jgi:hypothetical protein
MSERQLSNDLTAAKPLPEVIRLAQFTRQKSGEWKDTNTKYLVRRSKYGFVYKYSRIGDTDFKEKQFALIPLGGPYYAFETPAKGGFAYELYYISADGIYRWEALPNITKPIIENPNLQERLGVSCDDKICKLSSTSTLKNIMSYILSQDIPPHDMYKII